MVNEVELKSRFLEEALQILDSCRFFSRVETAEMPDPLLFEAALGTLHNLKGGARIAGLPQFATLTQEIESLLVRARSPHRRTEALQSLHEATHLLRDMTLELMSDLDATFDIGPTLEKLRELSASIPYEKELILTDAEMADLIAQETRRHFDSPSLGETTFAGINDLLSRAAEETARTLRKEVKFEFSGTSLLFPESVVAALADPLLHLMRNAIDHWIETPAERALVGKVPEGRVTFNVAQMRDTLLLTCTDDGRGMDEAELEEKARAKGYLKGDSAVDPVQLIFLAGFSTRDEVTDLSGRGIGMDVVRDHVEKLDGDLRVQTTRGKGTTFQIEIPLRRAAQSDSAA